MLDYSKIYKLKNKLNYNPQLEHSGQLRKGVIRKAMGFGNMEYSIPAKWSYYDAEIIEAKVIPDEPLRFIYRRQAKLLQYTICEVRFHLFHEGVVELLDAIGATGISYYPTIIEHKREKRIITNYFGIQITGRYGDIDKSRGEIVPYIVPNGNVDHRIKGMYFTDDKWGGLDFSVGEKSSFVVTSERIMHVFNEHKISGANFIPLPEFLMQIS